VLVVDDKVANYGCCYEAGQGKEVWDVVDVFVFLSVELGLRI
jgi:hypothetical protein